MKSINNRLEKLEEKRKPAGLFGAVIIDSGIYIYLGKKYTKQEWESLCKECGIKHVTYIHDDVPDDI